MSKALKMFGLVLMLCSSSVLALPKSFVYLRDIDPTIIQEIRYAGSHNFVGRPIQGYHGEECILTRQAAIALSKLQKELLLSGYSLKVYDCYRPQKAVNDFVVWSQQPQHQETKQEFYPRVDKKDLFVKDYIAEKSGHSRGSTVDLTFIKLPAKKKPVYVNHHYLVACYAPVDQRYADNTVDMGTGYDCMDELSHIDNISINLSALCHRAMLREMMAKYGFVPFVNEWWHFTLAAEPFKDTYFDFDIDSSSNKNKR